MDDTKAGRRYGTRMGDCRAIMATFPEASMDAIVTDPPYELGFMGKGWDRSGVAFDVATWEAAYRVLKPGGHLLAFGGTRTFHRLTVAIEDAGFEIRDCLMWLYGSGFPKSLDVSKAIDKRGGYPHLAREIGDALREAREARGMSTTEADKRFCGGTTNWTWFEGRPKGQRAPTMETFSAIVTEWPELAPLADKVAEAEREVTGEREKLESFQYKGNNVYQTGGDRNRVVIQETRPATDAARQWDGWGTALKPAWEPIVVARKPLVGTVAANVLAHGTGGLNIDGCRIGTEIVSTHSRGNTTAFAKRPGEKLAEDGGRSTPQNRPEFVGNERSGRWPANVVLDEDAGAILDAQSGVTSSVRPDPVKHNNKTIGGDGKYGGGRGVETARHMDEGGASRFFYCAKASTSEREAGLLGNIPCARCGGLDTVEHEIDGVRSRCSRNTHPTVKPVSLMRWLVRLVTPPNGLILDPFMGSATTGLAALDEGFRFVGIEQDEHNHGLCVARLSSVA